MIYQKCVLITNLQADEAYCIGPAPSSESYVRVEVLIPNMPNRGSSYEWTKSYKSVIQVERRQVSIQILGRFS